MNAISNMVWVLNFLEIAACITGFISFKKLKNTYWKWLPFYLFFIVCLEFTGRYFASTEQYAANLLLFKYIGFPAQFFFFYFMFYKHRYYTNKSGLVVAGGIIYLTSIIIETIFLEKKYYWFHSFSYSVGNVILLVLLLTYFFTLIKGKDILYFSNSLMFWFSLGLLVYYLGTLPYWALRNMLIMKYRSVFESYSYVMLVLNYCMYLLFITGIIKCRPK